MALEQWEKDLRRQLSGVRTRKLESWENDLLQEIEDVQPRKTKNNTTTFVFCLIMLGIMTLFAYNHKTNAISQWWQSTNQNIGAVPPLTQSDKEIAAIKATVQSEAEKVAKLQDKVKFNSQRIALTGMVMNENSIIIRNNYDKNHLIFFNRDWTLDQMPHYLKLSEEDKEYLKKYVKPQ